MLAMADTTQSSLTCALPIAASLPSSSAGGDAAAASPTRRAFAGGCSTSRAAGGSRRAPSARSRCSSTHLALLSSYSSGRMSCTGADGLMRCQQGRSPMKQSG